MADGGVGFVGRCDVVEPRRGNRWWPDDLKARIVAESLQPGARVGIASLRISFPIGAGKLANSRENERSSGQSCPRPDLHTHRTDVA